MSPPGSSLSNYKIQRKRNNNNSDDFRRQVFNVDDFQRLSKKILPKDLYEYLSSGTDDEITLRMNRFAFQSWCLRPRVLRPIGNISTATTLFGKSVSMPIFCSPAGVHALCEPKEGECATAKACSESGILFGLSQHATRSIEQVAAAAPPSKTNLWYQAYILKDRDLTLRLIRRAIKAGYSGFFVTVDSVRFGFREADARNGFNALPSPHRFVNYDENEDQITKSSTMEGTYNSKKERSWDQNTEQMFEQNVTWMDIRWMKKELGNIPLVVKGIMTKEDAELAINAGADGIMVSNHGGRQLDGCLSTIDALPEVVEQVDGRVPVWLDGGVRRGTDVIKALALGAKAVGIGKPIFFSLAVAGQDAVSYMFHLLKIEVEAAMALCGVRAISEITTEHVTRLDHIALGFIPPFMTRSFL